MKNCDKNHLIGRINLRESMGYVSQIELEKYLEGLGLSSDAISYVSAHPNALRGAYNMVGKNPRLSLEEAVIKLSVGREEPEETGEIDYETTFEEEPLFASPFYTLPEINTMGNSIPIETEEEYTQEELIQMGLKEDFEENYLHEKSKPTEIILMDLEEETRPREIPFSCLPKRLQNLIGVIDEEDFYTDPHFYEHGI
jgi:hypothetical protein